jgi:signal transduction histidine kinase
MASAGVEESRRGSWAARAWEPVRGVSDRTSLRTKLVAAMLALVIVAIGVMSFVSIARIKSYLIGQADQQLNSAAAQYTNGQRISSPSTLPPIGTASVVQVYSQSGQWVENLPHYLPQDGAIVALPVSPSWLSANANANSNSGQYETVIVPGAGQWRVFVLPVLINDTENGYLVSATDLSSIYATARQLTGVDVIVSVVIVIVLAFAGVVVVTTNLRPLVEIEETAEEIAEGHLNRRIQERDPRTEIGSLGRSLNTMLSQIETAFHEQEKSEEAARQSEEAARRSEEAARQSEDRMRRFIADASHELRTPLTAIRGFAEYYRQRGGLVQQWDDEEPRYVGADSGLSADDLDRIMHRVEAEAARMGLLVEDLLLLARLDQQRPLAHNPVDLITLAADAVHDTRMLAPNRSIELHVQPGAAYLVNGDEPRLRQVIGNLMSNALTHTPDGSPIEVSISSGVVDPRSGKPVPGVLVDVKDHGPGMTAEQADRVFERFYRADQARGRATGGSGLGLAIVASLVAAHGGLASVRTAPGHGATFRVALPLAPEAQGWDDAASLGHGYGRQPQHCQEYGSPNTAKRANALLS